MLLRYNLVVILLQVREPLQICVIKITRGNYLQVFKFHSALVQSSVSHS